jgi:hypothetical protein
VLGSDILAQADADAATLQSLREETTRREEQGIRVRRSRADEKLTLIEPITAEQIAAISTPALEAASMYLTFEQGLVAEIGVNRDSPRWRSIEARHLEQEISTIRELYPFAPADLRELEEYMQERSWPLGHQAELGARAEIAPAIWDTLGVAPETRVEIQFPATHLRIKQRHHLEALVSHLFGIAIPER